MNSKKYLLILLYLILSLSSALYSQQNTPSSAVALDFVESLDEIIDGSAAEQQLLGFIEAYLDSIELGWERQTYQITDSIASFSANIEATLEIEDSASQLIVAIRLDSAPRSIINFLQLIESLQDKPPPITCKFIFLGAEEDSKPRALTERYGSAYPLGSRLFLERQGDLRLSKSILYFYEAATVRPNLIDLYSSGGGNSWFLLSTVWKALVSFSDISQRLISNLLPWFIYSEDAKVLSLYRDFGIDALIIKGDIAKIIASTVTAVLSESQNSSAIKNYFAFSSFDKLYKFSEQFLLVILLVLFAVIMIFYLVYRPRYNIRIVNIYYNSMIVLLSLLCLYLSSIAVALVGWSRSPYLISLLFYNALAFKISVFLLFFIIFSYISRLEHLYRTNSLAVLSSIFQVLILVMSLFSSPVFSVIVLGAILLNVLYLKTKHLGIKALLISMQFIILALLIYQYRNLPELIKDFNQKMLNGSLYLTGISSFLLYLDFHEERKREKTNLAKLGILIYELSLVGLVIFALSWRLLNKPIYGGENKQILEVYEQVDLNNLQSNINISSLDRFPRNEGLRFTGQELELQAGSFRQAWNFPYEAERPLIDLSSTDIRTYKNYTLKLESPQDLSYLGINIETEELELVAANFQFMRVESGWRILIGRNPPRQLEINFTVLARALPPTNIREAFDNSKASQLLIFLEQLKDQNPAIAGAAQEQFDFVYRKTFTYLIRL